MNENTTEIIWKPIKGFEGLYEISNMGEVKSFWHGNKKILKTGTHTDGYKFVCLCKNSKQYVRYIHRLVATAFVSNPNGYNIVNHKDENKTNNNYSNLEWCTPHYNNTYNGVAQRRGAEIKGREAWSKGKTNIMSAASREKIRKYRLGRETSDETRKKISESIKKWYKKRRMAADVQIVNACEKTGADRKQQELSYKSAWEVSSDGRATDC